MYSWNDIKISVTGDNTQFIDGIKKYINAVYVHDYEGKCDIKVTVCNMVKGRITDIPDNARKVKSLVFNMNFEFRLDILSHGTQIWFLYRDIAEIWIDYQKNEMNVCTTGMPLDFEYYNTLLFFLHPLGSLIENFGHFRLHSSCISINGQSLLITGKSGSGKSTSAFTVPTHGGQIISDDLTFVLKDETGYHPSSLSSLVKLRDNSINMFFPELNRLHEAAHFEDETYFFLADINKIKYETHTLNCIAILEKTGNLKSAFKPVHPSEIVPELFPSTIHTNIEENTGRKFVFITDMLNDLKSYKMSFGTDMTVFYDQLQKLLDEVSK